MSRNYTTVMVVLAVGGLTIRSQRMAEVSRNGVPAGRRNGCEYS